MSTWTWLAVVALVVVVAVALMTLARRRSTALQERFGPEYNRAVEAAGLRGGEADLAGRTRRHDELHLITLSEPERLSYAQRWRSTQERFVDRPADAVDEAERLLTEVMEQRGYPVTDFEEQAELVSVDHPQMVQDYRVAHEIHVRNLDRRASTEDLREALLRYRSLFDDLLRPLSGHEPVTTGSRWESTPDREGRR
ncbi:MAG: hypothetical protein IPG94_25080 [Kineosporiaceae bacterium]|nr:hypothetical protein [Kineosporiaceae bacterium]